MLVSNSQCDSPRASKAERRDASVGILKDSKANEQLLSSKGKESLQQSKLSNERQVVNINLVPKMNHDAASQSQVMVVHQEKTVLNYNSHQMKAKETGQNVYIFRI